ncbi:MAG TPA: hypothetical protein VF131_22910 [Blastocatellia bacterium]|nr:hypothetical protein [Blastocatellia bacterium]
MKPAPAARELTQIDSLRAQIRVNETWQGRSVEDAEARSLSMFSCPIDQLTTEQAYEVLKAQAAEQPDQEPHDGYCMTCERPSSLRQCMDCREGRAEGYRPQYQSIV